MDQKIVEPHAMEGTIGSEEGRTLNIGWQQQRTGGPAEL
jgi:hypothetical protein